MSKKDLTHKVIEKIKKDNLKVKPRWVFTLGAVLSGIGIVLLFAGLSLAFYLFRFTLSHPRFTTSPKFAYLVSNFPWYWPVIIIILLVSGYLLLRRFDFSYRQNIWLIFGFALLGTILGSLVIENSRLPKFLESRGFLRFQNRQEIQIERSVPPRGGRRWGE